jgi:GT2 family glycosyltransferase
MPPINSPLVLAGMHRSGTSLAASLLASSGLHLGDKLMPAAEGNREGHFEDLEFVSLHEAALHARGVHPDGWDEVVVEELPRELEGRARALVLARSSRPFWGWKDPRTTLFLPFWERLLPGARFVFLYRNPWEVIDSLYRRGDALFQGNPEAAARLWVHYNAVILDALVRLGARGLLFALDDVARDPRGFVARVGRSVGLDLEAPADLFRPEQLHRGESLADWRSLSVSVLTPVLEVLRRLDEGAVRLPGGPSAAEEARPGEGAEGALLRQWAALRRTERERDDARAIGGGGPRDGRLQLFAPRRGEYTEARAVTELLPGDGRSRDYLFLTHHDASAPLRLDPGNSVGIGEIDALAVRSLDSGVAHSWSGAALASAPLRLANAVPVGAGPGGGLRFVSLNEDPQLYVDLPDVRGGCQVEIRLSFLDLGGVPAGECVSALGRQLDSARAALQRLAAPASDPRDRESSVDEMRRRLAATSERWRETSRALRHARRRVAQLEGELETEVGRTGELRAEAARSRLEAADLRQALGTTESRLAEASRARDALDRARTLRLARLVGAPWRRARSLGRALGRSRTPPDSVSPFDLACLSRTPLFDEAFYRATNPDVAAAGVDPRRHYLVHGAAEGRDPGPWFSTSDYLSRYPDVAASGMNPLVHYLTHGAGEGRTTGSWFDPEFYRERYADVADSGMSLLEHYVARGAGEGRAPSPWFDPAFYLERYPDVAGAGMSPLLHYRLHGAREGRLPNPWFDPGYYLATNPEVAEHGADPLEHFVSVGLAEGRRPNPAFDPVLYLAANPDVAASGAEPLRHYVTIGWREGRPTEPPQEIGEYAWMKQAIDRQKTAAIEALRREPPALLSVPREDWPLVAGSLVFEPVDRPVVSIVIPVFNQAGHTVECLASLAANTAGVPFEVILFDNGSTDATRQLFESVPRLSYLRSEENLGFVLACNRAAERARGDILLFLNNDTQVTPGWLPPLIDALRQGGAVGAAGPKIVFPDGRLQEAGGHVLPDGESELVGLFEDPELPRYNRAREVAYCSGVCLAVSTDRFRALGGFDPDLAPAYCEDVDLCLRLRAAGQRVLYVPESVIVHHLSVTAGSVDDDFKLRCVARNQQRIVEKHHALLDELNQVRLLAFYLPQFHPIPENDRWWGPGFTEWRNVARARPNFEGHDQPRLPADLGFYDLRLPEVARAQSALARRYGLHGFCYYYYWFAGRRLLETPLELRLRDRDNDFPFCVAWANENWTRTWDGLDEHVLIGQDHSDEDDEAVVRDLLRHVEHPAYVRISGRPLILLYRAALLPNPRRTVDIWRDVARRSGAGELYLATVESFEQAIDMDDPARLGFDASVEFPPHHTGFPIPPPGTVLNPRFQGRVHDYRQVVLRYLAREPPGHTRFRTVMTGWDNTPRRQDDPEVFAHASPGAYRAWLEAIVRQTLRQNSGEERIVFVNAWNEWAEGAYLEPDARRGHAYLEATRDALEFGPRRPA